ncbi:MAG: RluA family pseudouridine synthase, partial [Myxococcota bacterium]|nr:RluA family pseudouridine synthase [Myxococcota bacterium]
ALAGLADGLSRTLARKIIALGGVYLGQDRCKVASRKVSPGDCLTVTWHPRVLVAPSFALEVVHEDARTVVVDKPASQHVQGTAQGDVGTLAAALSQRYGAATQLAHRLDAPASGLVIAGRDPQAVAHLMAAFREHRVERSYLAIVLGIPAEGPCKLPLVRDGRLMRIAEPTDPEARSAHTDVKVLWSDETRALVTARLHTGRMHQVRAHLAALGAPLMGDRRYGGPSASRLCLHAVRLKLGHPDGEGELALERSPGDDFWEAGLLPPEARQSVPS